MKLPVELKSSKKRRLINIKNNDQCVFYGAMFRHINPVKIHPERITRKDKELNDHLDYDGIEFPVR